MAPVRHATDSLHATSTPSDRLFLVIVLNIAPVEEMETVLEVLAHAVPELAVRMA